MDIHIAPDVTARDVAEAHSKDLLAQEAHGCNCMTYWIDEARGKIFCLIEAPEKERVNQLHQFSHGLTANKVIEVDSDLVASFLGRIYDPPDAKVSDNGLKIFEDSSFRILLVTKTIDPVLLKHQLGKEQAQALLSQQNSVIRNNLKAFEGRESEHNGNGFIASFVSAGNAIACALAITGELTPENLTATGLKIGLNAGEPVQKSDLLFGDTIQFAHRLCTVSGTRAVAISQSVYSLGSKELLIKERSSAYALAPKEEAILESIFAVLEKNWPDVDFNVDRFAKQMTMSNSQLYRKTTELCNCPPNTLIRDFKLEKAKALLKQRRLTIAQITFDAGFSSPSYFTKCFKEKFGLLPMHYIDLLQ